MISPHFLVLILEEKINCGPFRLFHFRDPPNARIISSSLLPLRNSPDPQIYDLLLMMNNDGDDRILCEREM